MTTSPIPQPKQADSDIPPVDVLFVGHFARDRIVVDGRGETVAGGGVYYGSLALGRMGLRVAVATRLHPDDFPMLEEMKLEGIRVHAVAAGATSGIENVYDSADMERRVCTPLGFAGPIRPSEIPELAARVVMITPIMAGEVDAELVATLASRAPSAPDIAGRGSVSDGSRIPLGLDVQGFVRVREGNDLVFRPWRDMEHTLRHVTYLKADRAEAESLTGETDLDRAAGRLASFGPREVVITQTSGVTVFALGEIHRFPFTPRRLDGRTGRGDTCFAAYVGKRLTAPPSASARFAAAVTTLKQETPGPWNGDLDAVNALVHEKDPD